MYRKALKYAKIPRIIAKAKLCQEFKSTPIDFQYCVLKNMNYIRDLENISIQFYSFNICEFQIFQEIFDNLKYNFSKCRIIEFSRKDRGWEDKFNYFNVDFVSFLPYHSPPPPPSSSPRPVPPPQPPPPPPPHANKQERLFKSVDENVSLKTLAQNVIGTQTL